MQCCGDGIAWEKEANGRPTTGIQVFRRNKRCSRGPFWSFEGPRGHTRISIEASVRSSAAAMVSAEVRAISQAGQCVASSTGPKISGIDGVLHGDTGFPVRRGYEAIIGV